VRRVAAATAGALLAWGCAPFGPPLPPGTTCHPTSAKHCPAAAETALTQLGREDVIGISVGENLCSKGALECGRGRDEWTAIVTLTFGLGCSASYQLAHRPGSDALDVFPASHPPCP